MIFKLVYKEYFDKFLLHLILLTGQVNGKGKAIELEKPVCGVSVTGFGPNSEVITSPKVHGDVASILTWYSLRHTLNLGRQTPSHSPLGNVLPVQHFPKSFFPASLLNEISLNSNTPVDSAYRKILSLRWFQKYFCRV